MFYYTYLVIFINLLIFPLCYAEITFDGSLGTTGSLLGPDYVIDAAQGTQIGGNLFHSFKDFNIDTDESATFTGPNQVTNIIGRVTGGFSSTIDGSLKSTIPNANLYLLNPNGITLGTNASLDIRGSFHLSSADYLRFTDGQQFNTHSSPPILTTAAPEAFGFLTQSPGKITINSRRLEIPEGKDFSVMGGDIQVQGQRLLMGGGQLQIVSAASQGEVQQADIEHHTLNQLGKVSIKNEFINVGGWGSSSVKILGNRLEIQGTTLLQDSLIPKEFGDMVLQGQQIEISESSIMNTTSGSGKAGNIILMATDSIAITKNSFIDTRTEGSGKGGDISLSAPQLQVQNSTIASNAQATGQSGTIKIQANDSVVISGSAGLQANTLASGKGGKITISTSKLEIDEGFIQVATFNQGNAGHIHLEVDQLILSNGAQIVAGTSCNSTGQGGEIIVEVKDTAYLQGKQSVNNRGEITVVPSDIADIIGKCTANDSDLSPSGISSSTRGKGQGGSIHLTAQTLNLEGGTIQTLTEGEGKAGNIVVEVTHLQISQGGDIDASNEGTGKDKGGDIKIHAEGTVLITAQPATEEELGTNKLVLKPGFLGGIYNTARNNGAGGDVQITAGKLILRNGGVISVGSTGKGNAGNLQITVNGTLELENAAIITRSTQAGGGDIQIQTPARIHLVNSEITAQAQGLKAEHQGGNVTLTNQDFCILNNSSISASAKQGHGGDIRIHSANFIQSPNSTLDASSELGVDGQVEIESQEPRAQFDLVILPSALEEPKELSNKCAVRTRRELSQLNIVDRDVPPTTPADLQTHSIRRPLD
jgi:filamentous hemagglutinin family protein